MSRTTLRLRQQPALPVDARSLLPAPLAALSVAEIEALPLAQGRTTLPLAEIFGGSIRKFGGEVGAVLPHFVAHHGIGHLVFGQCHQLLFGQLVQGLSVGAQFDARSRCGRRVDWRWHWHGAFCCSSCFRRGHWCSCSHCLRWWQAFCKHFSIESSYHRWAFGSLKSVSRQRYPVALFALVIACPFDVDAIGPQLPHPVGEKLCIVHRFFHRPYQTNGDGGIFGWLLFE